MKTLKEILKFVPLGTGVLGIILGNKVLIITGFSVHFIMKILKYKAGEQE